MTTKSDNSFSQFVEEQERDPKFAALLDRERRRLDDGGDCPGCGAPSGYPPGGPCHNHGTREARCVV